MTLSVGAINNVNFTGSTNKIDKVDFTGGRKSESANNKPSISGDNGLKRAAKYVLIGGMAFPVATSTLTSCDKDWFAHAEAYAIALNPDSSCKCKHLNTPDTLYFPVYRDGKTDTIKQIVEKHDTIKVKDDFHSPVIDTINNILNDAGVDPDRGYIPLKVSFIDEMDTKYKKYLFDGDESAPSQVVYKGKKSPFNDDIGQFIIGSPLDESEVVLASLTGDGKLYLMKMIPKNDVTNPKSMDDYMLAPQSLILDRDAANKVIKRLGVSFDKSGREDLGIMEKGELPKTVKITNPYGTTWRYTNLDVESADPDKAFNKD